MNTFFEKDGRPKFLKNYLGVDLRILEYLRYPIDMRLYYFGDNFSNHSEKIKSFGEYFFEKLRLVYILIVLLFKSTLKRQPNLPKIWNASYHLKYSNAFENTKYQLGSPPWLAGFRSDCLFDHKLFFLFQKISNRLDNIKSLDVLDVCFIEDIERFYELLKTYVVSNNIKAVFLPHTVGFFEKIIVDVFKELKRPSFTFIHGLPYYWKKSDNLSDYFVVWGGAIKRNYINAGYSHSEIIVTGHPKYKHETTPNLKFDTNDILVITKAVNGIPFSDMYTLRDRVNCIVYLNIIQSALEQIGVSSVRLRPHPSENAEWYTNFIDIKFFQIDKESLSNSLKKSSLVIGPTSTVFLESLLTGVNYLVFEPFLPNGNSFDNIPIVPPFNGSDTRIPCAHDLSSISRILSSKLKVDPSVLNDYCESDFSIHQILEILS